jgi:hypothetical protein
MTDRATGMSIEDMTLEEYARLRAQVGIGRGEYGRGALDSASTADWVAAAKRKAGRSALNNSGTMEPPRLEGRYLKNDERLDRRPAAERFSTPGNSFTL